MKLNKKSTKIKEASGDRLLNVIIGIVLVIMVLLVVYPLWFIIIASVSDPLAVFAGDVWIWPQGFNLDAYNLVIIDDDIWSGYANTIMYTLVGTSLNIAVTMSAAYALSRKKMFGRNVIMGFIIFTMFFSGGLIPTYLQVNEIGLYDTFAIMVIFNLVNVYNLIVARTFIQTTISEELFEAAYIDGCTDARAFFNMVLPLSAPIIAVLILFYGVAHWNQYFNALIYLQERSRMPLQIILREILLANMSTESNLDVVMETDLSQYFIGESLKFAVIIVSSVPMLILYPFLQRFFIKGIMVGSVKG